MKPEVLEQQLPEEGEAGDVSSWQYAVPLTLDACRCPHLEAWLPHELSLDCVRRTSASAPNGASCWQISNPVHALHLASHLDQDGATITLSHKTNAMAATTTPDQDQVLLYGPEQRRTIAVVTEGVTPAFLPLATPHRRTIKPITRLVPREELLRRSDSTDSAAKSTVSNTTAARTQSASESNIVGSRPVLSSQNLAPLNNEPSAVGQALTATNRTAGTTTATAAATITTVKQETGLVNKVELPPISTEDPPVRKTVTKVMGFNLKAPSAVVPVSIASTKTEPVQKPQRLLNDEPSQKQQAIDDAAGSNKAGSDIVKEENKSALSPPTQESKQQQKVQPAADDDKLNTDANNECVVKTGAGGATEVSTATTTTATTAVTDKISQPPDKVASEVLLVNEDSTNKIPRKTTSIPSSSNNFLLPLVRYQQLRRMEDCILREQRILFSRRRKLESVGPNQNNALSKKKAASNASKKRKKDGTTTKTLEGPSTMDGSFGVFARSSPPAARVQFRLDSSSPVASSSVPVLRSKHDDAINQNQWEQEAMRARTKAEEWMEVLRLNRHAFWDQKQRERQQRNNNVADIFALTFGESAASDNPLRAQVCELCDSSCAVKWGGCSSNAVVATGDELLQCLECSFVGCAPSSIFPTSKQHILQHLLQTGHQFAITCGRRADLFCFRCGDFVYHELFDQEKERIDISQRLPWMGWKEHPVQRSFTSSQFVTTTDHGIVWRGLLASYPVLVPKEYIEAARMSMKRLMMFRGEVEDQSLAWGPKALGFATHQQLARKGNWRLSAPVGMYNLGNTCFMSAVIQCLVHCVPLQRYFLRDVGHHHETCAFLRRFTGKSQSSKGKTELRGNSVRFGGAMEANAKDICLACEMDILILKYFGSTVGMDAIGAVREPPATTKHTTSAPKTGAPDSLKTSFVSDVIGEPIVASGILTAAWRSGDMNHLAGYDQRDAHEFLQAFLDIMGKNASQHRKRIRSFVDEDKSTRAKETKSNNKEIDDDIVKPLFEGTLRSVLICEECGCKRSLSEPFLNISLPLAKEMERTPTTDDRAGSSAGTRLSAASKLNISVQTCLEHFAAPESLSDSVHCPSCQKKTPTKKQHTFAKLPRVLCLHLKRFDAAKNKKIDDFVSFPAHGLDMGPLMPHWCEVVQGTKTSGDDKRDDEATTSSPQILYDLFGTVNHTGSLHQGHYMANVKVNGQWYHCNDAFVCKADAGDGEQAVLNSEGAYVLFYIRR